MPILEKNLPSLRAILLFHELCLSYSLTVAARRCGIGVSVASKALKELREYYGRELFIRSKGEMFPTEFARTLFPEIHELVGSLERITPGDTMSFSPERSFRTFRILATDFASHFLLKTIAEDFTARAPRATIEVRPLTERYLQELRSRADLAVFTPVSQLPTDYHSLDLFTDTSLLLARADHPLVQKRQAGEKLLPQDLTQYPKVDFLFDFHETGKEDAPYDEHIPHVRMFTAFRVSQLQMLLSVVRHSNAVALVPGFLGRSIVKEEPGVASLPLPLGVGEADMPFTTKLIWHDRVHADPAIVWLRSVMASNYIAAFKADQAQKSTQTPYV